MISPSIKALLLEAHEHQKNDRINDAIAIYQHMLTETDEPHHAIVHHHLANAYAAQNNDQKALLHYRDAVHAQPDYMMAHYHLGLFLLKQQELTAAEKQFNNVLALHPEHIESHFYLGLLHLIANRLDDAEQGFLNALSLQESHVFSITNLGVIALKRELGQVAVDYFTKALVFDPNHIEARNNLAATFMHHDRFENALMHYGVLLDTDPNNLEYLYNSGVAQMTLGHLPEAIAHFETILRQDPHHFAALNNLAAIQMRLGHRADAITLLKRARIANPSDSATQFMLHALTGDKKHPTASSAYVSNLFDNYALYYDQHMQGTLKYTLPHQMMSILHRLGNVYFKKTLDLGCGTGLSGEVLRESSEQLTGIDIAAKMIAQARSKGIYDTLIEAELLAFLTQDTPHYDLITALDVLPYSGDLQPLFECIQLRLTQEGLFVFSCEISTDEPWRLQDSARFCHHPDYIQALCKQHHLTLIFQEQVAARQQEQRDLYVSLYIARKISP